MQKKQLTCPHCGYRMPVWYADKASCTGVFIRCKNKGCKKEFEIKIKKISNLDSAIMRQLRKRRE